MWPLTLSASVALKNHTTNELHKEQRMLKSQNQSKGAKVIGWSM